MQAFWEDEIHVVLARKGEASPVYDVRPERGQGHNCTLHRNMLLPCDYLPAKPWQELPPVRRYRPPTPYPCDSLQPLEQNNCESDSDDDLPNFTCYHLPSTAEAGTSQLQIHMESTTEETFVADVNSDELIEEAETEGSVDGTPNEVQIEDNSQIAGGQESEDASTHCRKEAIT